MKMIVGNWKMNLGIRESVAQARGVLRAVQGKEVLPHIVLCPSFTALADVRKVLVRTRIALGAQSVGPARAGAWTGEVGAAQLEDVGVQWVLVGHSERRALGESDDAVHQKVSLLAELGLSVMLCVGESSEAHADGQADEVVVAQVRRALHGVKFGRKAQLAVAYEPVWAIGTQSPATPQDAVRMAEMVRAVVLEETGMESDRVSVLYGGSVDGKNAYSYLREPAIDGLLVGGASLKPQEFESIIDAAVEVMVAQQV